MYTSLLRHDPLPPAIAARHRPPPVGGATPHTAQMAPDTVHYHSPLGLASSKRVAGHLSEMPTFGQVTGTALPTATSSCFSKVSNRFLSRPLQIGLRRSAVPLGHGEPIVSTEARYVATIVTTPHRDKELRIPRGEPSRQFRCPLRARERATMSASRFGGFHRSFLEPFRKVSIYVQDSLPKPLLH